MPRARPPRRVPRSPPTLHRHRMHGAILRPTRTSDFVIALPGVVLLGALALAAATNLVGGPAAP